MIKNKFKNIEFKFLISNFSSIGLHIIFFFIFYSFFLKKDHSLKNLEHFEIINAEIIGLVNQTKNEKDQIKESVVVSVKSQDIIEDSDKINNVKNLYKDNKEVLETKEEKNHLIKKDSQNEKKVIENFKMDSQNINIKKKDKVQKTAVKDREVIDRKKYAEREKVDLEDLKASLNRANKILNEVSHSDSVKDHPSQIDNLVGGGENSVAVLGSEIKSKLIACWKIPPMIGIEAVKDIYVILKINLDISSSVTSIKVENRQQYINNHFFDLLSESAIKAVQTCSPVSNLPRDMYDDWKEVELVFNPSKFLN